jgi:hypothetical protein
LGGTMMRQLTSLFDETADGGWGQAAMERAPAVV